MAAVLGGVREKQLGFGGFSSLQAAKLWHFKCTKATDTVPRCLLCDIRLYYESGAV